MSEMCGRISFLIPCVVMWMICLVNFSPALNLTRMEGCRSSSSGQFGRLVPQIDLKRSPKIFSFCSLTYKHTSIHPSYYDSSPRACGKSPISTRVKLQDIIITQSRGIDKNCREPYHYHYYLGWRKRDRFKTGSSGRCFASLVRPFLKMFSWTNPEMDVIQRSVLDLGTTNASERNHLITYTFTCEEDKHTVDLCESKTTSAINKSLNLLFKPKNQTNSYSCFCTLTSPYAQDTFKVKALDLRMNKKNALYFDSKKLPWKEFYWWQDDYLSTGFTNISLLHIDEQNLPERIWLKVNFRKRLTITCNEITTSVLEPTTFSGINTQGNRTGKMGGREGDTGFTVEELLYVASASLCAGIFITALVAFFIHRKRRKNWSIWPTPTSRSNSNAYAAKSKEAVEDTRGVNSDSLYEETNLSPRGKQDVTETSRLPAHSSDIRQDTSREVQGQQEVGYETIEATNENNIYCNLMIDENIYSN